MSASNYPGGAYDDPNAPYNLPIEPKYGDFECHATITIEADISVPTNKYQNGTAGIDWEEEYKDNCFTIPEMLDELKIYVEQDLAMTGKNTSKGRHLQSMLKACQGWKVVETEIEKL